MGLGVWLLDAGFGHPRGPLGRLGGRLMARGNGATERHVVELAELAPGETVLVLGPGPGVGLRAAGLRCRSAVGVEPSKAMLRACRRWCADLVDSGAVHLVRGDAEHTGQPDASADAVVSVNNVMLWPDRHAGFTECLRVLRPGGRLAVSAHEKWLPGGPGALAAAVERAGFGDISTGTWEPPGRIAATAAQLRARRPSQSGCEGQRGHEDKT